MWQSLLTGGLGAAIFGGIITLIQWGLNRKAAKEDRAESRAEEASKAERRVFSDWQKSMEDKINALVDGQKFILYDRIQYLGRSYIHDKEVDFDDRRRLYKMHETYHMLGGNGDLNSLMDEVERLPLREQEVIS